MSTAPISPSTPLRIHQDSSSGYYTETNSPLFSTQQILLQDILSPSCPNTIKLLADSNHKSIAEKPGLFFHNKILGKRNKLLSITHKFSFHKKAEFNISYS